MSHLFCFHFAYKISFTFFLGQTISRYPGTFFYIEFILLSGQRGLEVRGNGSRQVIPLDIYIGSVGRNSWNYTTSTDSLRWSNSNNWTEGYRMVKPESWTMSSAPITVLLQPQREGYYRNQQKVLVSSSSYFMCVSDECLYFNVSTTSQSFKEKYFFKTILSSLKKNCFGLS